MEDPVVSVGGGESLPEGWECTRLGLVVEPRHESVQPRNAAHLPYVGLEHIEPGNSRIHQFGQPDDVRSAKSRFYPGDVLYGKLRPYLDKAALAESDGICSTDILVLVPCGDIDPSFASYLLHSTPFIEHAVATTTGVNHPRTSWNALQQLVIYLPPLSEQRAIAHALSTIQSAIGAADKVITAIYALKQSTLRHLLTYGLVQVQDSATVLLKDSNVGPIPQQWSVVTLGEVSKIGNGSTPKRDEPRYWDGGTIPWLTSGKVHEGTITSADELVTEAAYAECHLPLVPKRSIVVAITGQGKTLGNAALLALDTCISQHLAYITLHDNKLQPEFVLYFLQSRYMQLQAVGRSGGSTKAALTCGYLKGYSIPCPPIVEQRAIVQTLYAIDRKIETESQRKSALQALFKSALQRLMTGTIRVGAESTQAD